MLSGCKSAELEPTAGFYGEAQGEKQRVKGPVCQGENGCRVEFRI